MKLAYYPGCSMEGSARMYEASLQRVMGLLGVIGFISASQFGTSVNSLMPVSSGGVLFKLRSPGSMESKVDEISAKMTKVLAVVTINSI